TAPAPAPTTAPTGPPTAAPVAPPTTAPPTVFSLCVAQDAVARATPMATTRIGIRTGHLPLMVVDLLRARKDRRGGSVTWESTSARHNASSPSRVPGRKLPLS